MNSKQLSCLADAQVLYVFDRLHSGRGLEATKEGALFQPGLIGHIHDAGRPAGVFLQPVLNFQDRLVAMRQARSEGTVMPLFAA